jgi:hypothetical protein
MSYRALLARTGALVCVLGVSVSPPLSAQERAAPVALHDDSTSSGFAHYAPIVVGSVAAATWNQVIGMPEAWPRTWHGYGYRLGDQAGFAVAEETLRAGLGALVPWRAAPDPCVRARRGHGFGDRLTSASGCALRSTFVARNPAGRARPNVPLLGAVVGASAISLAWRPERASASKGQLFVVSRVGVVLAGTVANRAWTAWRR